MLGNVFAALTLFLSACPVAYGQLSLSTQGPTAPILTGQTFSIRMSYRVASTTGSIADGKLEVVVPAEMEYIGFVTSPHVASYAYDPANRRLTATYVTPLAAGTAGDVDLQLAYRNGSTADGLRRDVAAVLSAGNAAAASATQTVEAQAESHLNVGKWIQGEMTVDAEGSYMIRVCNGSPGTDKPGSLSLTDVGFSDVLPAGAEFVRFAFVPTGLTVDYDAATRTASGRKDRLDPGQCVWQQIVVRYPSGANAVGDVKTNTADSEATPVGAGVQTASRTMTHTLRQRTVETRTTKTVSKATLPPGADGWYKLAHAVTGTAGVAEGYLEDLIPYETEVRSVDLGDWHKPGASDQNYLRFDYSTNLHGWRTWRSGMDGHSPDWFAINAVGLSLGGPEYITGIRVYYGDAPAGTEAYVPVQVNFVVRSGTAPGTVTNCSRGYDNIGGDHYTGCVDFDVVAGATKAVLTPKLTNAEVTPSAGYGVGEEVRLTAGLKNEGASDVDAVNVRGTLLLPPGMTFVPGSVAGHYPTTLGVPTAVQTPDYGGSGRTLVTFRFPAGSRDLVPRSETWWGFSLRVGTETPGGSPGVELQLGFVVDNDETECWGYTVPDPYDIAGDGAANADQCVWPLPLKIAPRAGVSTELAVRGSLDSDYTTYPARGTTLPGGLADYRLRISNDGNIPLDGVKAMSILPAVGDLGVVDPQARESRWAPRLVGPVDAPAGATVYYSTATNPCRAADGFLAADPSGCTTPAWSPVPPTDITTVHALLIDFGATQIARGETLEFTWPMRTPTDVLQPASVNVGDVAWNSVGVLAARSDNGQALLPAEPNKTGLAVEPLAPGVVGDRVWADDGDGIQEAGEAGLNGVRVDLYRDNGDGVADIANDAHVDFTLTTGDGNYLFPALPSGNYFVLYEVRPTYTLGPARRGTDRELDSDGAGYYANGRTAAVSEVFAITDTQFDFSRDLALVPTGDAAVGDYVWRDIDRDGTQNEGVAAGVNAVELRLLSSTGAVVATTRTRPDLYGNPGYYLFDAVTPGTYRIELVVPDATDLSAKRQGGDRDADSDADPATGLTDALTLPASTYVRDVDFALQLSGTEQCDNGIDDDGNGLADCLDPVCGSSPSCTARFACDNTLYQTIKGSDGDYRLYRVEVDPVALTELSNLTASGLAGDPNSTILNPRDGYVYTVDLRSPWAVYRVTGDYAVSFVGNLATPPGTYGYNAGAVDRDGNWLVREYLSGEYHLIDLNTLTATVACAFPDALGARNIGDLDYNPVDGKYYGTVNASDSLIRYDFATCSREYVEMDHFVTASTGAFWVSAVGMGYAYENSTGNLLRIDLQSGATDIIDVGPVTAQTDGCSCQGVSLGKDAVARTIRKGEINTYEFTLANRYVTALPGARFFDRLPAGARWVGAPYDLSPGLSISDVSGDGTRQLGFTTDNVPQIVSTFKIDYVVDPTYDGAHPMPNQAELRNLPTGIGTNILSDDLRTPAIGDPTLVWFVEHCTNGIDDDLDGDTDCEDRECPLAAPVLRVNSN